jgi:hypothetical protein
VAIDDGVGDVDDSASGLLGVLAELLEGRVGVDAVAFHEDHMPIELLLATRFGLFASVQPLASRPELNFRVEVTLDDECWSLGAPRLGVVHLGEP